MSTKTNPQTIGKEKAKELATAFIRFGEGSLFPQLTDDARKHLVCILAGNFKGFYKLPDGRFGHVGIENTVRQNENDQAKLEEKRKSA